MKANEESLVTVHTHTPINLIDKKRVGEISTLKIMQKNRLLFNGLNAC